MDIQKFTEHLYDYEIEHLSQTDYRSAEYRMENGTSLDEVIKLLRNWAYDYRIEAEAFNVETSWFHRNQ